MKKGLILGLVVVLLVISSCDVENINVDKEEVNWKFCSGYSPGGMGGVYPGYNNFYVYIMNENSLYLVDHEFVGDVIEFETLVNEKIDYYWVVDVVETTETGIIVDGKELTEILDDVYPASGTIGGCMDAQGKTKQEVKLFFEEKISKVK